MKAVIFVVAITLGLGGAAHAQYRGGYGTGSNSQSHGVSGHYNSSGTYVQPHQATNPNNTQTDNYGTRGNYNPYTGAVGTRTPRY